MRLCDVERLSKPYSDGEIPEAEPAPALGVEVPSWMAVEKHILGDLSVEPPYGIAWWAPHPGTSRRILISDQLYASTHSVLDNLVEAALHLLEFADWSERENDRFAHAVTLKAGRPVIQHPRPQHPLDVIGNQMVRLHVAGAVRALAGTLDCVAGTVIGILALPIPILTADFRRVRARLTKLTRAPSTEGERAQSGFALKFEELIDSAGPTGWLEWALAFRNMLVHRGRRTEVGQFVPRTPFVFGPHNQPVLRASRITHLPRDPGRSDVEVFLEPSKSPILTESDHQTLTGLLESTQSFVEALGAELLGFWNWRKDHPQSLSQPSEQWPNGPSTQSSGFLGYAPGSFEYSPGMLTGHPVVFQRMRAAALLDAQRPQWRTFE